MKRRGIRWIFKGQIRIVLDCTQTVRATCSYTGKCITLLLRLKLFFFYMFNKFLTFCLKSNQIKFILLIFRHSKQ